MSTPVIPLELTGETTAEKTREILAQLEAGVANLFDSECYTEYLTAMSRFHNYSFRNIMLILQQKPDATLVAGFNTWKHDFNRVVKRGEHGIRILAPAPFKTSREVEKHDATGAPVIGKDGKPETETVEYTVAAFKPVTVFDVSQTEGDPVPNLGCDVLTGDVSDFDRVFTALQTISPSPIAVESMDDPSCHGFFSRSDNRIVVRDDLSEVHTVKTVIHEIAHAVMHNVETRDTATDAAPDYHTREVQAESVAYVVCQHFGLDTSDYSFGYIAGWSNGRETTELKASLATIQTCANDLINQLETTLAKTEEETAATAA